MADLVNFARGFSEDLRQHAERDDVTLVSAEELFPGE